ncbi:MAG: ATP-dependent RecD-like DNA helicase [Chloroflexota bacterium]|nr:ATP-dependent RecD-like DNA helicase [Chloroflexota bacterium]
MPDAAPSANVSGPVEVQAGATESLDGVVDRITYVNEENGYSIARLKVPRQKQLVTIAGYLPAISVGEGLRIEGQWQNHASYGRQFSVLRYQSAAPGTVAALKRYLGSGLLKGVGPVVADHIVNTFGLDTLEVLDANPGRLLEVPGISRRKALAIGDAWRERRALKEMMTFLQAQGLPVALAVRILKKYGNASEAVVREQPYRLAAEVYGVSFSTADSIAAGFGISGDAPQRVAAGVAQVLREAASEGHVYLPLIDLLPASTKLLGLPLETLEKKLPELETAGFFIGENNGVEKHGVGSQGGDYSAQPLDPQVRTLYLPEMHAAELAVAETLRNISKVGKSRLQAFNNVDWDSAWRYLDTLQPVQLSEQQREAVRAALTERVVVITGGPGTGKTTTLRGIVQLAQARGVTVVLAAPTGRAAKRLSESTGVTASTIHRLLELKPGGQYEVRAPLDADLVIVDEASMMDLPLAEALVKAVPRGAHLLLVGDADQLPPVGPGAPLRDIIASGVFRRITLQTIFRQAEGSAIVSNAHLINQGSIPLTGKGVSDFFFLPQANPALCAELVVDLATRRVPNHYRLDPLEDIQVIVPIYGGVCGVDALNVNLQAVLNPPHPTKDERRYGGRIFRVGDKVMQLVNSYDRQVSNGELGRIVRIDLEEQTVNVSFDSEWSVEYAFQELDELTHAYAISVHKAQGSEYPCVIMPVLPQAGRLLQRNLLYTAVSRARSLVILTGSMDAIKKGVETSASTRRYTGLVWRIKEAEI